jgi:hypothetical protein
MQRGLASIEALDSFAVELFEQVRFIGSDVFDQVLVEGFLLRKRL